MPPHAPRASMAPRAVLLAVCVLLLAAVSYAPTVALGSSLLMGGAGFVMERPLLLQGVDVGAVLSTVQAALQTAQEDIAELKLKNGATVQQHHPACRTADGTAAVRGGQRERVDCTDGPRIRCGGKHDGARLPP